MSEQEFFFPAVSVIVKEECFEATAGITVSEIHGLGTSSLSDLRNQNFQAHLRMLQSIAAWPHHVGISFNLLTNPRPSSPLNGTIGAAILLSVQGKRRDEVVAEILSRYTTLLSLLSSLVPATNMTPIMDDAPLQKWIRPFTPCHSYLIDRVTQCFLLVPEGFYSPTIRPGFLAFEEPSSGTAINYTFPWEAEESVDFSNLDEILLYNPSPIWYRCQLYPGAARPKEIQELQRTLTLCEEAIAGMHDKGELRVLQAQSLRSSISERIAHCTFPLFRGCCFVCSEAYLDEALVAAIAENISPTRPSGSNGNILPFKGGNAVIPIEAKALFVNHGTRSQGFFSIEEALCGFRIPGPVNLECKGFPVRTFRTRLHRPSKRRPTDQPLLLGHSSHRNIRQPVQVCHADRMRHMLILGQTGTGKSTLVEHMILQDITHGRGLCFIDPHGDSIETLLHHFPDRRSDDLVLLDFQASDHILPFNILSWKDNDERDRIIEDLLAWLERTYDMRQAGGPMFETYLRSFLKTLISTPRQDFSPTLPDLLQMFLNRNFLDFFIAEEEDPDTAAMLELAMKTTGDHALKNMAPYVVSKFNRFLFDSRLQPMISQPEMAIDFELAMDKGKVIFINLGKGRFGSLVISLLASQIVNRLQNAIMKRSSIPVSKRRDFFLYIDEFQNVVSESFVNLLSECRKFGLGIVMANQYAHQLDNQRMYSGNSVLEAVLGNVGSVICFRLGITDAKMLADVFYPAFSAEDLVNLPLANCYANLNGALATPDSFNLITSPPLQAVNPGHAARLRRQCFEEGGYYLTKTEAALNIQEHQRTIRAMSEPY